MPNGKDYLPDGYIEEHPEDTCECSVLPTGMELIGRDLYIRGECHKCRGVFRHIVHYIDEEWERTG